MSPDDTGLYTITNSCDKACKIIEHFYSNYHSIRFVGERLVVRLQRRPDDAQLADLNEHFAHLVSSGSIERAEPTQAERRDDDHLDLARIGLKFDKHGFGDLIALIGRVNGWPTPTAFIP